MIRCILIYFRPFINDLKDIEVLIQNHNFVLVSSFIVGLLSSILNSNIGIDYFGISIITISFVMFTVFANAFSGIVKAKHKRREYRWKKDQTERASEKRRYQILVNSQKFSIDKVNYIIVKLLVLFGYLFMSNSFVKTMDLSSNFALKFIDMTAEVLIVIPLFTFWYKEFKSIGENIEVVYNKKPSLFGILEDIVELKLTNFLKRSKQKYDKSIEDQHDIEEGRETKK